MTTSRTPSPAALLRRLARLLAVLPLVVLAACQSEGPNVGVTLSDVANDPEAYYGQMVVISGEVDDVFSPTLFTIGGDDFGDQVLVVSADPIAALPGRNEDSPLVRDDIVQVVGMVRPFAGEQIQTEYGLDLSPFSENLADFEGEPIVVASSAATPMSRVAVSPRQGGFDYNAGTGAARGPVTDVVIVATAARPLDFADVRAELTGVTVQAVVSDKVFWVGPSDTERLVARLERQPATPSDTTEGRYDINAGQTWSLTGTLQPLPDSSALASDWGLSPEQVGEMRDEDVYLQVDSAERQE